MILVAGGTGFIGSHACVELMSAGHEVVILDNLCNSKREVVNGIGSIVGKSPVLVKGDIRNAEILEQLFKRYQFDAVMHFAGLKSVSDSVAKPLQYYENNVYGSMVLFRAMANHGIKRLGFSSSATVYGKPPSLPIRDDFPLHATNPYGRSKLMIEKMLQDIAVADPEWSIAILRYFNPDGAHNSGLIGEAPNGVPNNLMPFIAQVAAGQRKFLSILGNDYPTPDGTGIRDYIHVLDLATGHLKALEKLMSDNGIFIYNLGTGHGSSVLDMVGAFKKASNRSIPYKIFPRRVGDVASSYADPSKAQRELAWKAKHSIEEICADSWRWQMLSKQGLLNNGN